MPPMSPDSKVRIWDANDKLKEVRLITLNVWVKCLALEMKGLSHSSGKVSKVVRKFLGYKPSYPIKDLYDHLKTSLDDIHRQMDIAQT